MQLTGKQIVDKEIIYGVCKEGIQQQGVDVRLMNVAEVGIDLGDHGFVPKQGKTETPCVKNIESVDGVWKLKPGYYEIEFAEGCKLPNNAAMYFKTRSSLVRCGAIIHSGQFDAGFSTSRMGAFLHVIKPIWIEVGARVAQAIVTESYNVDAENMYDGQWQNDKQRLKDIVDLIGPELEFLNSINSK